MAISRKAAGEMIKAGWVGPPPKVYGGTDYLTEERFREVKESGINLLYILTFENDFESAKRMVELAEKEGIYVMVPDSRFAREDFDVEAYLPELEFYKSHKNVLGLNIYDEPGQHQFPTIAKNCEKLRPYMDDLVFFVNHMPMYATPSQLSGSWWSSPPEYENETTAEYYYDFMDSFYKSVDVCAVSYDFYPFRHEKGVCDPHYFDQLFVAKKMAEKYGKDIWNFTQVTSWNRDCVRNMTYGEISWLNNTSIACGVTGLQYFCYWTPCDGVETFENAMISRDGRRTKHFYFVKDLNEKLDKIAPFILSYKHVGVIVQGDTLCAFPQEFRLRAFGNIKRITSDGVLVGCFEKDGKFMYYAVNTSVFETRLCGLHFNKTVSAETIVGMQESDFCGSEIYKPLAPGEGMLVVEK